jgi:hypothetical protein
MFIKSSSDTEERSRVPADCLGGCAGDDATDCPGKSTGSRVKLRSKRLTSRVAEAARPVVWLGINTLYSGNAESMFQTNPSPNALRYLQQK